MERYAHMIVSAGIEQRLLENNDPILNVVNPFVVINPKVFPTLYTIALTILITGVDLSTKDIIEVTVTSPSGEKVFSTGRSNAPNMPEGTNITMNLDLKNIILREEGKYEVVFILNDSTLTETRFYVKYILDNKVL